MKFQCIFSLLALQFLALPVFVCSAADEAKPATSSVSSPSGPLQTLSLEVAVLRFKPDSADRILRGFKELKGNLAGVIETLKADGSVSILYSGTRDMRLEEKATTKFDALETKPVVLIGKPGAPVPPVTSYGLALEISAKAVEGGRVGLTWDGSMTWSPDVVDEWKGEKFLSFLGSAAGVAKKASSLTGNQSKEINSGVDIGLSFAQLFNPKGGATESQIYEMPVNKTISLSSSRNCKAGELIVNATTSEMGNKEAQTILLLIWPTILP